MPWHMRMTLWIALLSLPISLYTGWRLSVALHQVLPLSKKAARLALFLVILWIYLLPLVYLLYYKTGNLGDLFIFSPRSHWLDYLLLYPFWAGFIILAETAPFFLVLDIPALFARFKRFPHKEKWILWSARLKIVVAVLAVVYVGVRITVDTGRVRLDSHDISIENLPSALEGLDLCLVGDVQVDRYTQEKKLGRFRARLEEADGDILLFAGDLVTRGTRYVPQALAAICGVHPKLEKIACMGDHDYWSAAEEIPRGMRDCGWTFLQNAHRVIPYRGHKILVTGVTHIYSKRVSRAALEKLLAGAPRADLKILLVHQPREFIAEAALKHGFQMMLAGHTHGGQIVPRPFGIPVTASLRESAFYSGYYNYRGLHILVTNGVGLTLAPVRYNAPAEVTRISLSRRVD